MLYAKGYHGFPPKLFCVTIPKNFEGEPFGVSEKIWYRKNLCFRGLCHDFLSKFFRLTVLKNFLEEPFCAVFQKIYGSEKVYGYEGGSILFSHSTEKLSGGTPLCFTKFLVSKKHRDKRGWGREGVTRFCLTVPKNSVGESFIVALISGIEKVGTRGGKSRFSIKSFLSHCAENFRRGNLHCCINFW